MLRAAAIASLTLLVACGSARDPADTPDAAHVHTADAHADDAHVHAADDAASPDAIAVADAHVHADLDAHVHGEDAQASGDDAGVAAGIVVTAELHGAVSRAGTHVHIQVTRGGAPLEGATVTVALWMPAHGHGAPAPAVDDEGGGAYHAIPAFTMAGHWELTITAASGGESGRMVLGVDVP